MNMIEIDHEVIFIKWILVLGSRFFGQFDEIEYLASKISDCN